MLIVTAQNVTAKRTGVDRSLVDAQGFSDYDVWVGINQHMIFKGSIAKHRRDDGAQQLLRRIADAMDADKGQSQLIALDEARRMVQKVIKRKLRCKK